MNNQKTENKISTFFDETSTVELEMRRSYLGPAVKHCAIVKRSSND